MRIRTLLPAVPAAVPGSLLAAAPALAANGEQTKLKLGEQAGDAAVQAGSSGGGLVRTIVGLAIVIAVIYGLTWVLRQVRASRDTATEGAGLESIASLSLGPNRSLHLVRAGEEVVLVGAGEHGVTPIRTYTEAEARALGLLEDAAIPGSGLEAFGAEGGRARRALEELRRRTVIK